MVPKPGHSTAGMNAVDMGSIAWKAGGYESRAAAALRSATGSNGIVGKAFPQILPSFAVYRCQSMHLKAYAASANHGPTYEVSHSTHNTM